jgi:hypothetical protein
MIKKLLKDKNYYENFAKKNMRCLALDRVNNVRINLSQSLNKIKDKKGILKDI